MLQRKTIRLVLISGSGNRMSSVRARLLLSDPGIIWVIRPPFRKYYAKGDQRRNVSDSLLYPITTVFGGKARGSDREGRNMNKVT
jgi:hypothetical protein